MVGPEFQDEGGGGGAPTATTLTVERVFRLGSVPKRNLQGPNQPPHKIGVFGGTGTCQFLSASTASV